MYVPLGINERSFGTFENEKYTKNTFSSRVECNGVEWKKWIFYHLVGEILIAWVYHLTILREFVFFCAQPAFGRASLLSGESFEQGRNRSHGISFV